MQYSGRRHVGKSTPETTDWAWGCFTLPTSGEIGNDLWLLSISLSTVYCATVIEMICLQYTCEHPPHSWHGAGPCAALLKFRLNGGNQANHAIPYI